MPRQKRSEVIVQAYNKRDETFDEIPDAKEDSEAEIEQAIFVESAWVDPVLAQQLDKVIHNVKHRDMDFVCCIDGSEGCGKSVFTFQVAKYCDPTFNLTKICFNSEQFITAIKSAHKHAAIVLDEAFSSANARASLSDVNRALIGLATEMRQKNLFVFVVLPSIFDLDRYFALWRCRVLIHLYVTNNGQRGRYVIFPRTSKKLLYLFGKKTYNYSFPPSPYPPCRFRHQYVVDEMEYRKRKAEAFRKRTMSGRTKRYKEQRDALVNHFIKFMTNSDLNDIFMKSGVEPISNRTLARVRNMVTQKEITEEEENEESPGETQAQAA